MGIEGSLKRKVEPLTGGGTPPLRKTDGFSIYSSLRYLSITIFRMVE